MKNPTMNRTKLALLAAAALALLAGQAQADNHTGASCVALDSAKRVQYTHGGSIINWETTTQDVVCGLPYAGWQGAPKTFRTTINADPGVTCYNFIRDYHSESTISTVSGTTNSSGYLLLDNTLTSSGNVRVNLMCRLDSTKRVRSFTHQSF